MSEILTKLSNNKQSILVGILAFGGGLSLGYFLANRNKEPTYQVIPGKPVIKEDPEDEILSVSDTDTEAVQNFIKNQLGEKLQEKILVEDDPEEPEPAININIFHNDDEWDYEVELAKRTPTEPYVIHKDEFYEAENGYSQHTLTYYSGDNILCDEDDTPVYNHETVVGEMKFGHGSGDPNVFHVRNDRRKAEYEILHDPGMFSVEVLGLEIEDNDRVKGLKHSGDHVRKFRTE